MNKIFDQNIEILYFRYLRIRFNQGHPWFLIIHICTKMLFFTLGKKMFFTFVKNKFTRTFTEFLYSSNHVDCIYKTKLWSSKLKKFSPNTMEDTYLERTTNRKNRRIYKWRSAMERDLEIPVDQGICVKKQLLAGTRREGIVWKDIWGYLLREK